MALKMGGKKIKVYFKPSVLEVHETDVHWAYVFVSIHRERTSSSKLHGEFPRIFVLRARHLNLSIFV